MLRLSARFFISVLTSAGVLALVSLLFLTGSGQPETAEAFTGVNPPYFFAPGPNPYLTGFTSAMISPGKFVGPTGIVFGPTDIYVADAADSMLYVFSPGGGGFTSRSLISGCSSPVGLTTSAATVSGGGLYVACFFTSAILEINYSGGFVRSLASSIGNPRDVITDSNGDVLVSSAGGAAGTGTIYRITMGGAVSVCATGSVVADPDGLTIHQATNTIYVSSRGGDAVVAIPLSGTSCGAPTTFATFTPGTVVDGIAIGASGSTCEDKLLVNANDGNMYEVTISNPSGSKPAIATGTERGDLVKVSPDGYLYATQSSSVAKIGPNCFIPPETPAPTESPSPSPTPSPTPVPTTPVATTPAATTPAATTPAPTTPAPTTPAPTPTGTLSAVGGTVALNVDLNSGMPWTILALFALASFAVLGAATWYGRRRLL